MSELVLDYRGDMPDEEMIELETSVDRLGVIDVDEMLGILHAVAIAPTYLHPARWLTMIVGASRPVDVDSPDRIVALLVRAMIDVSHTFDNDRGLACPTLDMTDACIRFARGFVRVAEMDPIWIRSPRSRACLAFFAVLCGRSELAEAIPGMACDQELQARIDACTDLDTHLYLAGEINALLRRRPDASLPAVYLLMARDQYCPCGSGREFKWCCKN